MSDENKKTEATEEAPKPALHVTTSPHLSDPSMTTQRMMIDVLLALVPALGVAAYVFGLGPLIKQVGICVVCCVAADAAFAQMRGKPIAVKDCSAALTGVILALSLPWSAPIYVTVIASIVAIGLGKAVFGGLGYNLFNPAMVGRAFVMLSFAGVVGATAYVDGELAGTAMSQATPLTALKQDGVITALKPLLLGTTNGSLGEVSALALLAGGIYLCIRRTASWEIPAGSVVGVLVFATVAKALGWTHFTAFHHLLSGAFLFGAFFIATDPVSSPVVPKGKFVFGVGYGFFVVLIRVFSGYPEGVMFAVLLMNAMTPLINRWLIPRPLGGPVLQKA